MAENDAVKSSGNDMQTASPSENGALQVREGRLCDEKGDPVQLRGVSTHGIAWYPEYVNRTFFRELKQEWEASVVRLAMYTAEYGGYCEGGDRDALKALIRDGVRYAAEADLYAIVDWHILSDNNPNMHLEEAKDFFREMSADFSEEKHVLYEICNEPNGGTTWQDIRSYAEEIIPVIRANDPDAVILVGTPTWSQDVDQAAANPLDQYDNIMYTLHFYAGTHKDNLRDRLKTAAESGLPLFVSEFGITDASGNGAVDTDSAGTWIRLLDQYGISYVCWNLSNKDESSAIFKTDCSKTSGFEESDLKEEGIWLRNLLRSAEQSAVRDIRERFAGVISSKNKRHQIFS